MSVSLNVTSLNEHSAIVKFYISRVSENRCEVNDIPNLLNLRVLVSTAINK